MELVKGRGAYVEKLGSWVYDGIPKEKWRGNFFHVFDNFEQLEKIKGCIARGINYWKSERLIAGQLEGLKEKVFRDHRKGLFSAENKAKILPEIEKTVVLFYKSVKDGIERRKREAREAAEAKGEAYIEPEPKAPTREEKLIAEAMK